MRRLYFVNEFNESINITYEPPYILSICDGFHEVKGNVQTISSAFGDGERFTNTSIGKRDLTIKGTIIEDISVNRRYMLNVFKLNRSGMLYYYDEEIERKIPCYVESVEIAEKQGYTKDFVISLVCPRPYFQAKFNEIIEMAELEAKFKFPMNSPVNQGFIFGLRSIDLMGEMENITNINYGLTITFKAVDTVVNPYLLNVDTSELVKVTKTLQHDDYITVTTHNDNKNVILYTSITNTFTNINYLLTFGSVFMQLKHGKYTIRTGADSGEDKLETTIEYTPEFESV